MPYPGELVLLSQFWSGTYFVFSQDGRNRLAADSLREAHRLGRIIFYNQYTIHQV